MLDNANIIHLIQHYGYVGIGLSLALEFIGFPVPGEPIMTYFGFLCGRGEFSLLMAIIFSTVGTYLGSYIAYIIGYRYGENFFIKYGKYIFLPYEKLKEMEALVNKNKGLLLLFSRFIPVIRHITPYIAGISKMDPRSYALYNLASATTWCSIFIWFGFLAGEHWAKIEAIMKGYTSIVILLLIFIFVVVKYFGKYKKTIFLISFPLMIFAKLTERLIHQQLKVFDTKIYDFIHKVISDSNLITMQVISLMGLLPIIAIFAIIIFLISRNSEKFKIYGNMIVINLFASWIFNEIFQYFFRRVRPSVFSLFDMFGFSFPSSHSMIGISFYGLITYFIFKETKKGFWHYFIISVFILLILFIAISRVYIGDHYASDEIAGLLVGFSWLAIFTTIIKNYYLPKNTN